jgi:hypothetical protein
MKKMLLTGLGSEQRFDRIPAGEVDSFERSGDTEYYLVFNDGELRVPIHEEAVRVVVQFMYGDAVSPLKEAQTEPPDGDDSPSSSAPEGEGEGGTDEDGVDQI